MWNEIKLRLNELRDIHWKIQESNNESILFFKITETSKIYLRDLTKDKYKILVVNQKIDLPLENCFVIPESDWPQCQKEVLDILYPLPTLKLIGITGTNGKTTTTDLVLQLGEQNNLSGFSIGTLGVRQNRNTIVDFGLTSPSYIDFRKYLYLYGKNKDFCVVEVSSHALDQERLYQIYFDVAGWTSFSQDHLDYHKTMDDYFNAKLKIFHHLKNDAIVFVPSQQTDLFEKVSSSFCNVKTTLAISGELPLFFSTQFNLNNLEVAKSIIEFLCEKSINVDYDKLIPPDGRFYIKTYRSSYIVVDFAHTPDALQNICESIKKSFPSHKLKVLFGCGGNRDISKRSLMGRVAQRYAEKIYVTSDNPRNEDPDKIIADIITGIESNNYVKITQRPEAVQLALSELGEKEILLLAGKGHENYILINGVKHPYSDIERVESFLKKAKDD